MPPYRITQAEIDKLAWDEDMDEVALPLATPMALLLPHIPKSTNPWRMLRAAEILAVHQGYMLVAYRSRYEPRIADEDRALNSIDLQCKKAGIYTDELSREVRQQEAISRKTECPFKAHIGRVPKEDPDSLWMFKFTVLADCAKHANHIAQTQDTFPENRRFTVEQHTTIRSMTAVNVEPKRMFPLWLFSFLCQELIYMI